VTTVKVQFIKLKVNVVYLQAILPEVAVRVTGLEGNVVKVGGQINRVE
jgi:hypothetical protein